MTNASTAKALMEAAVAAEKAVNDAIAPHLQEWLDLEVRLRRITEMDARQEFRFVGLNKDGTEATYKSEAYFDEYREVDFGEEVQFPLAFLDDTAPFYKKAEEKERKDAEMLEAHEMRKLTQKKEAAEAEVARITARIEARKNREKEASR